MDINQEGTLSSSIDWEALCEYEKKRYSNLIKNWEVLKSFGITPKLPDFMLKKMKQPIKNNKLLNTRKKDAILPKAKFKLFAVPTTRQSKMKEVDKGLSSDVNNETMIFEKEDLNKKSKKDKMTLKEIAEVLLEKADKYLKRLEGIPSIQMPLVGKSKNSAEIKRRYPKRNVAKKCYKEEDISSDDEFLHCDDCGCDYKGACPKHGPMLLVCDTKAPKNTQERAARTVPSFLSIGRSSIPKAGLGVWTEVPLSKGMVFGPYKGHTTKNRKEAQKSGYAWLIWKGGKTHHFVEGYRSDSSSWLRFVNCADREERQNLVAFQYKKKIYYKTYKPVLPFQELFVWYGGQYAADLGIHFSKSIAVQPTKEVDGVQCDLCKALFTARDVMERHRKNHRHQGHDRRHRCSYCDYSTVLTSSLRCHLRVHSGEKPFSCTHCHKAFTQISHLRTHQRIHTGEKPFSCGVCGRTFNQEVHLRHHERTHSTTRPYRCPTCGKDFTLLSTLIVHQRIHTQQKPYKCPHCDYRSSQSSILTSHVTSRHTRQFPHTCSHCTKGFITPSQLKKHMIKKHS